MSSGGPEKGCPEPVYPRELRASSSEFRIELDLGHEGEGLIYSARKQDELPMNVALARRLDSMSEREWEAVHRYHLDLAAEFDGPGGP